VDSNQRLIDVDGQKSRHRDGRPGSVRSATGFDHERSRVWRDLQAPSASVKIKTSSRPATRPSSKSARPKPISSTMALGYKELAGAVKQTSYRSSSSSLSFPAIAGSVQHPRKSSRSPAKQLATPTSGAACQRRRSIPVPARLFEQPPQVPEALVALHRRRSRAVPRSSAKYRSERRDWRATNSTGYAIVRRHLLPLCRRQYAYRALRRNS